LKEAAVDLNILHFADRVGSNIDIGHIK
jgi:hypothetical protein